MKTSQSKNKSKKTNKSQKNPKIKSCKIKKKKKIPYTPDDVKKALQAHAELISQKSRRTK